MKTVFLLPFLLFAVTLISQPPADGLICWFPFTGNANDETQNGYHGQVFGPILTSDRHGNPNSAYHFDGIDDFIQVSDQPDLRLGATSFTISAWIKPDGIVDIQSHAILSKRNGAGNQGYLLQIIGTEHVMGLNKGAIDIVTSGGWDDTKITTNAQLAPSEWHHIIYCYDKITGLGQFFIDNVPDIEQPMIDANGNVQSNLFIGKDDLTDGIEYPSIAPGYFGGFHFFGAMDDIRIYNRKLLEAERNELFGEELNSADVLETKIIISIQPDPVFDFLRINTQNVEVHAIAVHDSTGRLIISSQFFDTVDCRNLPSGSFVISFFDRTGRLVSVEKFIKG